MEKKTLEAVVPFQDLPLNDDLDAEWSFTAADGNAILGDPPDWGRYKKAHVIWDPENPEVRAGYKLPIAKMVGGQLKVFWRGVAAAMAALRGSRGGVDVSAEDKARAITHLKRYYAKFDKPVPESVDEEAATEDEPAPAEQKPESAPIVEAKKKMLHSGLRLVRLIEQQVKADWEVICIQAGCGANRCYSEELLQRRAADFEGLPVYDNHARTEEEAMSRDPKDLMGFITNPRYEEREIDGKVVKGIFATFHITNPTRAAEVSDPMYRQKVSFSLYSEGTTRYEPQEGGAPREVVEDFRPLSVDMVMHPAQGGRFAEHLTHEKEKKLIEQVKELKERVEFLEYEQMIDQGLQQASDLPEPAKRKIKTTLLLHRAEDVHSAVDAYIEAERKYLAELEKYSMANSVNAQETKQTTDKLRTGLFEKFGIKQDRR